MEKIMTIEQIAKACDGFFENCDGNTIVADIETDSRKICEGSVFVALRGEKFDGHNFVSQAQTAGAVCCIVDKDFVNNEEFAVVVCEDTYKALRDIAAYYRNRFSAPSVGITGSVGKTSTKDMVACVLENSFKVLKTEGNFNNEIGLPLTAFGMESTDEIAVFEMGMSDFGEISRLTKIAAPETAIITNIGFSHIEHLGSQEGILQAKLEILEGMPASGDGTLILNGDDPLLWKTVGTVPFETLTYGIENKECDIIADNIKRLSDETMFDVKVEGEVYHIRINTPGVHHVYNALAAILTGIKYGMSMDRIVEGIANFKPQGLRQNIEVLENYVIIKDCYNASPTSMKSGLEVLTVTKPKDPEREFRRVAVLGDMLELGDYSDEAHMTVGGYVCDYEIGCLIAVGPHAELLAKGAIEKGFNSSEIYIFYDNNAAKAHILDILQPNDVILFKASRGMRLEEIAEFVAETDTE